MFSNAVTLFTINRINIRVDPSWIIIAGLLTWSLSKKVFPSTLPGENDAVYLIMAVSAMLGLFGSLLLHELAHSLVAQRIGVPVRAITLFLFGGVAELDAEPRSARDELWIALAGPAMSAALSATLWVSVKMAAFTASSPASIAVLTYLSLINLVLALFNLVPAFPLDGGRVLRAYLWHRGGDVLAATRMAARSGALFGYGLMALGVVMLFRGAFVSGLWQVMIGGFVLMAARASYEQQLVKTAFDGKCIRDLMRTDPVTISPDVTLSAFVNQIVLRHGISFVPVTEDDVLLGHMDRSVLLGIDRENWANTQVGDVFVGMDSGAMVDPDMPVQDLLETIKRTGRRKFMVVSGHRLVGVVTLSDLTRHLQFSDGR